MKEHLIFIFQAGSKKLKKVFKNKKFICDIAPMYVIP